MIELPEFIEVNEDCIFYINDKDFSKLKQWILDYERQNT